MTIPLRDEILAAAGAILMWAGYLALAKLGKALRKADESCPPSDSEESWQATSALLFEHERERQAQEEMR